METRQLGADGPQVTAFGLGCMGMSGTYSPADDAEGIATVHAAIDAGVTLLDTGDFYGMGHNEWLIRRALRAGDREKVALSVKFGVLRDPDGGMLGVDGRPAAVKTFLTYSLQRLGADHVDIYRPARLDPTVPIEDTIGAIAELVQAGHVRGIGLSEVGSATIRRAHAVHPITDLQIEYSLFSRGIEDGILATCRELGIGITAYGVLARGLLSGNWTAQLGGTGPRARLPRFQQGNVEANLALVEAHRLGARPRPAAGRHRRARRRPHPAAPHRDASRGRADPDSRRSGRDRAGGARDRGRRRALPGAPACASRQRALIPQEALTDTIRSRQWFVGLERPAIDGYLSRRVVGRVGQR